MNNFERNKLKQASKKVKQLSQSINDCLDYDIEDLDSYYSIYKGLEELTFEFGTFVFDYEVLNSEEVKTSSSFDIETLTDSEKTELKRYLTKYCSNRLDDEYTFEKYKEGYKTELPYLLNRRVTKGIYFSPKKKYVTNVFEQLLKRNKEIIKKFSKATVVIVSYSPFENGVVRDNDNVDSRDIINLIKRFLMCTDDSGKFLNVMYDTQEDNDYRTEVYILPYRDFRYLIH